MFTRIEEGTGVWRADVGVVGCWSHSVYNDGKREPGITSTQAGVPATHVMKVSRARHILTNQINIKSLINCKSIILSSVIY